MKYFLGFFKDSLIVSSRRLNKQPFKYYVSVGLFFLLLFTVLSVNYFQYNNSITSGLVTHLSYLSVICLLLYQYKSQFKKTRKAEKKAEALELRFQDLYDSGVIGLLYVKLDGRIVEINQTFFSLTGNEPEMTRQKQANWDFLLYEENKDIIGIPIESLKTNGICAPFEKEFLRMDGKRIFLLVTSFMLQEKELADAIICVLDITQNRFEDQKALQRNKDEFLGIASHELRTPITGVQASLQMLDKISANDNKLNAPKIRPFISVANRQIKKLSRLVNQLLDGHRIQSGKMRLNLTEFIFQDSLHDCLKEIASHGNNQKVTIDENSPISVKADRMRIEQVIHSLLSTQLSIRLNLLQSGSRLINYPKN